MAMATPAVITRIGWARHSPRIIQRAARLTPLGRVDKVSDPQPDRRDENEAEEAIGGFVVSRG